MTVPESNEQKNARIEVKSAIENLLLVCQSQNAVFCGFVYGVDPAFLIKFGNVKEDGTDFRMLLNGLCDLIEDRPNDVMHDSLFGVDDKDLN